MINEIKVNVKVFVVGVVVVVFFGVFFAEGQYQKHSDFKVRHTCAIHFCPDYMLVSKM